jgi:hypothetical protein
MTLLERVRLFRELGFFADAAGQFDEEVVASLDGRYRAVMTGEPDFSGPLGDQVLLGLDQDRVWWEDLESDVFPGQDAYVRIFAEWARISRGAFLPTNVREEWAGEEGPVTITFTLDGQEHRLVSEMDEWIDLGLLNEIDELIRPSGYSFDSSIQTYDQTAMAVVLTADEKARLLRERPELFADDSEDDAPDDIGPG